MARLASTGFELNSVTSGVEFGISGSPTISSTTVRSGLYAGRISSLTTLTEMSFQQTFGASDGNGPFYMRVYLNIATLPSANNDIIGFHTSAGVLISSIALSSTGTLILRNGPTTAVGSPSAALSTGTWYRIEWLIDNTGGVGAGVLTALVDGVQFASSSSITLAAGVSKARVGGNLNNEAQTQGDWFFDDWAINDSTGSFQTSYPGSGKIVHMVPDTSGDVNTFATQTGGISGSGNNYTRVLEVTPDDATTFNGSSTLNQEDLFNVSSLINQGTISLDASTNSGEKTSVSSVSYTHTGGTLTNGAVYVRTMTRGASLANITISGITYGGVAMTNQSSQNYADVDAGRLRVEIWKLPAPANGSQTVAVTYGGTVNFTVVDTITLNQVDQATTSENSGGNNAAGQASPISNSVTTITKNAWILDAVYSKTGGAITKGASQTQDTNVAVNSGGDQVGTSHRGPIATPASTAMSWTYVTADDYAQTMVVVKPYNGFDVLPSDVINVVQVGFRFRNSTADATAVVKAEIEKTGSGTITQSSGITPNTTSWNSLQTAAPFAKYNITTYQDPDSANWTQSTIDTMQIGYKLTTGPGTAGRRIDITKVWALVDYTPASGHLLPLMGVGL